MIDALLEIVQYQSVKVIRKNNYSDSYQLLHELFYLRIYCGFYRQPLGCLASFLSEGKSGKSICSSSSKLVSRTPISRIGSLRV